jgi:hypothetical protein
MRIPRSWTQAQLKHGNTFTGQWMMLDWVHSVSFERHARIVCGQQFSRWPTYTKEIMVDEQNTRKTLEVLITVRKTGEEHATRVSTTSKNLSLMIAMTSLVCDLRTCNAGGWPCNPTSRRYCGWRTRTPSYATDRRGTRSVTVVQGAQRTQVLKLN